MQQDYPEIVTKLQLLLSTGMNLRKSVERIAGDYVSYMRREEVRKAYEILVEVCGEMEAVLEKKRLMNSWENVGDCCLIVHCLPFWYSACRKEALEWSRFWQKRQEQAQRLRRQAGADPWGAGIHQAAVPDDFQCCSWCL